MRPEFIVASKEFRDHLTSKRFLVIFAVLLLLSAVAIATGMDQYNKTLESYKKDQSQRTQQDWYKQELEARQAQIQKAIESGAPQSEIDALKYELELFINPPMPSMMYVFGNMTTYFTLIGMVLAISMGFDLITREKEEGSLKSLLSHPVFRDSVINGKTLGALAVLLTAMSAAFLIILAIMLFFGVVPTLDQLLRMLAYFLLALIYCLVFFSISMMTSALAKNSAMSIMFTLGVVLVAFLLPNIAYPIADFVMGSPPQYEPVPYDLPVVILESDAASSGEVTTPQPIKEPIDMMPPIGWDDRIQDYYNKHRLISESIVMLSPMSNFNTISNAILNEQGSVPIVYRSDIKPYYGGYGKPYAVWDALASVWVNLFVMLIMPVVAFVISYVGFMRMDVR